MASCRSNSMFYCCDDLKQIFPPHLYPHILLVGGSLREILTGGICNDLDIVSDLSPETLLSLGFFPVEGRSTPVIYLRSHPLYGKIEVTLHPPGKPLSSSLCRRDFRCNAVAMRVDGKIVDPLGGIADIESRLLVPCAPDLLHNDPIRIFRAFRFASGGWRISDELDREIRSCRWDDVLSSIPVERFSRELLKSLENSSPALFFRNMLDYGVGRTLFPELFMMQEIPAGSTIHHPERSLLEHSLETLERISPLAVSAVARLAALLHDSGKLATSQEMLPRHIGHDKRGGEMSRSICRRLRLPTEIVKASAAASALHMVAGRWRELRISTRLKLARRAMREGISSWLPLLVAADHNEAADPMPGWDRVCDIAGKSPSRLGISAATLDKFPPSGRGEFVMQKKIECLKMFFDKGEMESEQAP